ncbi:MAG: hypothetical protein ACR2P1_07105 [Pseudomonadales bacterium]
MPLRFNKKALTVAIAGSILSAPTVLADTLALEEVVVTAQKRAESLQDVPISVSAIDGQKIQDAGIQNFEGMRTQSNGVRHPVSTFHFYRTYSQ